MKVSDKTLSPSDVAVSAGEVEFVQGEDVVVIDERDFLITSTRALYDGEVTDLHFRVLCAYWSYTNKKRVTFVGQTRIARELGVSQVTVSNAVRRLRRLGYMGKAKRPPNKYGSAQTHGMFLKPVPQRQQEAEVEAMLASEGADGNAPPVPIDGFGSNNSKVRTDDDTTS